MATQPTPVPASTSVSSAVWNEIRSLPARLKALEQSASSAVASADLSGKVSGWEAKLQGYLTELQNLNIPARITQLESELRTIKNILSAGGASGASSPQGTAAQQTPAPAAPKAK